MLKSEKNVFLSQYGDSNHIDKALNDSNADVRAVAARLPNATTNHIDKALNDSNEYVRRAAVQNPNATTNHIDKALGDSDEYVRAAARNRAGIKMSQK